MIGLLNAYRIESHSPDYQNQYGELFEGFFKTVFPDKELRRFDVAIDGSPKDLDQCEAYIVSGSPKSAYDSDQWIGQLIQFIQSSYANKKKLIGICFGHQIIAQALGGRTEKAAGGWGVGVRNFEIIKNQPWMLPQLKNASLLMSHQDQVVKLPNQAELLARSSFCPHEMFVIGNQVLSFQGHPEFSKSFAKDRYDSRIDKIGQQKYNHAIQSLDQPTNSKEFGLWIDQFLKN